SCRTTKAPSKTLLPSAHDVREHPVTVDPNTPQTLPPGPFARELSSENNGETSTTAVRLPTPPTKERYKGLELWLHRLTVLMFGLVCIIVGVLLVVLPWRPEWTDNRLLLTSPGLRTLVANGFVRGLCSGLGLLDIWIGFAEVLHYHEEKPR